MLEANSKQRELFKVFVKNFIDAKLSHKQMLGDYFEESLLTVGQWATGELVPNTPPSRIHIMDYIWNHDWNCRCS